MNPGFGDDPRPTRSPMVAKTLGGARMPAETDPHERTLMAWPTAGRQAGLWGDQLTAARADYATIARTVAEYEPVTMVAAPQDAAGAAAACGDRVEILPLEIDDAWLRDSGPIIVRAPDGARHAVHFRFNAWGEKYAPYDRDATIGARLARALGLPVHEAPLVLEGGSIAVDGAGTLVTTERCLLNPNRNPDLTRADIEAALRDWLGAERIVWLADGIAEDAETDGHVDNVVAFVAPARAVLQGCADPANPNHAIAAGNRARLEDAGIAVVEVATLRYAEVGGRRVVVPYVNYYVANGVAVVPVVDPADLTDADRAALAVVGAELPGREIVPVPGAVLAYGGGGVHCITQPVPA
jgi:agmatine deiminase